jgi:peptidyl-prolyl cis-trans isomerase D
MLQRIHDQAQSWIAWVIVGLLIVPFALWGINSYFDGGAGAVVAEVNGEEIGLRDYQRSLQQQRERMRSLLGENYRPEMLESPQMRRAVLDAMVENDLLAQRVAEQGFRVGDGMLLGQIGRMEAFQQEGVFNPAIYNQVLAAQGMSKPFFENSLRTDLMQSQLRNGFRQASYVTDHELRETVRLQEQKRTLQLLTIPASIDRLQSQEVSEAEVTDHYEQNGHRYEVAEQVSLEYIELSVATLMAGVVVEETELQKLYEERKESLVADEERNARHILIELADGANEETTSAAEARLAEVESKLAAGEPFEALAEQYSDDPGSATAGGDLGFFPRGIMVPEFDQVVFAMAEGETSAPVRTPFGYHLIRLQEIQTAEIRPFEGVREELMVELKRRAADELFYEQSETMSNIAYEEPDSLEGAAASAGVEIQRSELFSRQGGEGVSARPGVVQAAFSDLVLKDGKNSDPIELADDHIVILRLNEHRPVSKKLLEEVRSEVVEAILTARSRSEAETQGKQWVEQLQQQERSEQQIVTESLLEWGKERRIGRDAGEVSTEVVAHAFRMAIPGENRKGYAGVTLSGGEYVIVALSRVEEGRLDEMESAKQQAMRLEVSERNMRSHYQSYIASLLDEAEVTVYEDQL